MKKIKFVAAGLGLALAVCSAFIPANKTAGQIYDYTGPDTQLWGQPVNDQNPSHYQVVNTDICSSSSEICTYVKNGTTFAQNEQGTFTGN